jgi:Chitobiase/beta-hexosaminidase C-terminal domain
VPLVFECSASITPPVPLAATPTFSPAAGQYTLSGSNTLAVSILDSTPGSTIYYTTDGSTPTTSSSVYTTPFQINGLFNLRAIATAPGFVQSAVGSASYTFTTNLPTFSPVAGTYSSTQNVSIFCSTPTSTIYYTTDGSTPTTSSAVYGTPIAVSASETIKAMATSPGLPNSPVASAAYVISSGVTFDRYVSTTGNDANPGTLAQPWALTSFNVASSNNALMAGKKIGMIAGTYDPSTLTAPSSDFLSCLMNVPGGSSVSPTYIASCNSSGVYTPRVAIIKPNSQPTNSILGGPTGQSASSSYVTIDGLIVDGNNFGPLGTVGLIHLLQWYGSTSQAGSHSAAGANVQGVTVQNCELRNLLVSPTSATGGNYALIFFEGVFGSVVQNNYLHNANCTNTSEYGHTHALEEYDSYGNQFINNTIANCISGIEDKDTDCGTIVAYNHFYNIGGVGNPLNASAVAFEGFDGYSGGSATVGPVPLNYLLHHNVLEACVGVLLGDQSFVCLIPLNIYNNTVYDTVAANTGATGWHAHTNSANLLSYYNNIYYSVNDVGGGSTTGKLTTGAASGNVIVDYNQYYQGASNYTAMWSNFTTAYNSLATWQAAMSADAHSAVGNPLFTFPSGYVAGGNPTQFQLQGTSPCLGTGQSGVNKGAWDGAVTQIGCNFVSFPLPSS